MKKRILSIIIAAALCIQPLTVSAAAETEKNNDEFIRGVDVSTLDMLEELLTRDDCANCKICCKFEEDELIDAPVFNKNQVEYIKKNINSTI